MIENIGCYYFSLMVFRKAKKKKFFIVSQTPWGPLTDPQGSADPIQEPLV